MLEKIKTLKELATIVEEKKQEGHSIVLCHGTFDLIHMGHIRHLQRAKEEGDILVVTLTADEFVNKGPGRPVFNHDLRAESMAALECVDYVAINFELASTNVINLLKPSVYVKGSDYKVSEKDVTGNITLEQNAVEAHGGKLVFTDDIVFSSTKLLNEYFDVFSPATREFLDEFKQKYSAEYVIEQLQSLKKLKVLVVGDAIIDQYHYTEVLGQTGKTNIIAVKYRDKEQFAGGSIAVANHVSGFVSNVTLLTMLGKKNSFEEYIRSKLADNISPEFVLNPEAPTTVKRRFVDNDLNKFFEVYFYEDNALPKNLDDYVCNWLNKKAQDYDLIIVPDFGNGFITENIVSALEETGVFTAVNTQINSGNRGYHVINRYKKADFISLNEPELRLSSHERHKSISQLADKVARQLGARTIAVTRGAKGLYYKDRIDRKEATVPILSTRVVDRVGAGDAFLSLASACLAGGLPSEVATFCGAVAAAMDVQVVCNRETTNPVSLYKYITTLLK